MTVARPCPCLCARCGDRSVYLPRYGRYACRRCNVWTDEPCRAQGCPFPAGPLHPFQEVTRQRASVLP